MPTILDYYEYAKLATSAYIDLDGAPINGVTIAGLSHQQGRLPLSVAYQNFNSTSVESAGRQVWVVPNILSFWGPIAVGIRFGELQ